MLKCRTRVFSGGLCAAGAGTRASPLCRPGRALPSSPGPRDDGGENRDGAGERVGPSGDGSRGDAELGAEGELPRAPSCVRRRRASSVGDPLEPVCAPRRRTRGLAGTGGAWGPARAVGGVCWAWPCHRSVKVPVLEAVASPGTWAGGRGRRQSRCVRPPVPHSSPTWPRARALPRGCRDERRGPGPRSRSPRRGADRARQSPPWPRVLWLGGCSVSPWLWPLLSILCPPSAPPLLIRRESGPAPKTSRNVIAPAKALSL